MTCERAAPASSAQTLTIHSGPGDERHGKAEFLDFVKLVAKTYPGRRLLRIVHMNWAIGVDQALRDAGYQGIRTPHANVFPWVPDEGIRVSELARPTQVREQSMTRSIRELEAMGYVERRPDPSDGRAKLVFLTDRGRGVQPVAIAAGQRVEAEWAGLVGGENVDALRACGEASFSRCKTRQDSPPLELRQPRVRCQLVPDRSFLTWVPALGGRPPCRATGDARL